MQVPQEKEITLQQKVLLDELAKLYPTAAKRFRVSENAVTPRALRNLIFLNAYAAALGSEATDVKN